MSEETKKKMLEISAILFKNNIPIEEAKIIGQYIEQLQQENQQLKSKQNQTIKAMQITKNIIKQQPSDNPNEDKFIIDKLNFYIELLGDSYE